MHFTEPLYRNPYWPTWPLIEITQGCTHNSCKFCTMYRGVRFGIQPMEVIEEDLAELRAVNPDARTIQPVGADPLVLPYDRMAPILRKIREYLPDIEHIYTQGRVSDLKNKTVEQLTALKDLGLNEISLGVESGDDWTLGRIHKGYRARDILEQCRKLEQAGIDYWLTFLNGVAGREHSRDHALHSAEIFSQLHPMVVGTGSLTLFPGTPLLEEAQRGEFDVLSEREMLEEMKLFLENLNADCTLITHHTSAIMPAANLSGPHFLERRQQILNILDDELTHGDFERNAAIRSWKRTL